MTPKCIPADVRHLATEEGLKEYDRLQADYKKAVEKMDSRYEAMQKAEQEYFSAKKEYESLCHRINSVIRKIMPPEYFNKSSRDWGTPDCINVFEHPNEGFQLKSQRV